MSVVDNVIVHVTILEGEGTALERLVRPVIGNQSLKAITGSRAEDDCDACWGGSKRAEVELFAAAFNHVDWRTLFAHIEAIPWLHPEDVQVLIKRQEGDRFGLYELQDQRLVPKNPTAIDDLAARAPELLGRP